MKRFAFCFFLFFACGLKVIQPNAKPVKPADDSIQTSTDIIHVVKDRGEAGLQVFSAESGCISKYDATLKVEVPCPWKLDAEGMEVYDVFK